MTELKQERIAAKRAASAAYRPKDAEIDKCNEYCLGAIAAFERFAKL